MANYLNEQNIFYIYDYHFFFTIESFAPTGVDINVKHTSDNV